MSDAVNRDAGADDDFTAVPEPASNEDPELDARVGSGVGEGESDAGSPPPPDRPDAAASPSRDDAGRGPDDDIQPGRGFDDPRRPPPPETRPRYAYRCRSDQECSRVRGVCDRGWCVQCRSWRDCPAYATCTQDRVCVRRPPPPPPSGGGGG